MTLKTPMHDILAHDAALLYQVWYQTDLQFRRYLPHKHPLIFWTFAVTLTMNLVMQFLNRTLQLMMLYYKTKFGSKWTSSLEDAVETVIFCSYKPLLWPWQWRQQPKFLHTLAHDAALSYPVWYQNDLWFRRYHPHKHSLTFWTFAVTSTLNAVTQFLHSTFWLMMLYYRTKFCCKWTSSWEDIVEIVIFWLYKPSLTLTLKIVNQFF